MNTLKCPEDAIKAAFRLDCRKQIVSVKEANEYMEDFVAYPDDYRLSVTGYLLLYICQNPDASFPSMDMFLRGLFPYVYPRLNEWKNSYDNDELEAQIRKSEYTFLSQFSIAQSEAVLCVLKMILQDDDLCIVNEDFDIAILLYWEERANGNEDFEI